MDDLNGLDWSVPLSNANKAVTSTGNYYPALPSTPPPQLFGRSTPLSIQNFSSGKSIPKPSTALNTASADSFSNLVSFGSAKQTPLTLQEQQEKLMKEKLKEQAEKKKHYESKFGNDQFWDELGNKDPGSPLASASILQSSTHTPQNFSAQISRSVSPPAANGSAIIGHGADEDLFAAFNSETKVDQSSHYPPPSRPDEGLSNNYPASTSKPPDLSKPEAWEILSSLDGTQKDEDDDPFGLGYMKPQKAAPVQMLTSIDDDDYLGDLGKPVDKIKKAREAFPKSIPRQGFGVKDDSWEKAISELVNMGFSVDKSRRALLESGSGLDIQAAVSWILDDAHKQAEQKRRGKNTSSRNPTMMAGIKEPFHADGDRRSNSALKRENSGSSQRQSGNVRSFNADLDISKTAAIVGNNLFKTANSLWKTSQEKVQKAVAEFQQQDSDSHQPKWMRGALDRELALRSSTNKGREEAPESSVMTDEALILEAGVRPSAKKGRASGILPSISNSPCDQSHNTPKALPAKCSPSPPRKQPAYQASGARMERARKELLSEQAYISPARRKKEIPQHSSDAVFPVSSSTPTKLPPTPRESSRPSSFASKPPTKIASTVKVPPRKLPHLSPIALQSCTEFRLAGTSHFKRGDYASAHNSYSSSLSALPVSHPLAIILLCNRALTSLKTGEPKSAVSDADMALNLIGESHGVGEMIDLGPGKGGGTREMKEYYGKALMRKAEALEQMERWRNAAEVWKLCVKEGIGGSTAIQGRTRCQNSLLPKQPPPSRPSNHQMSSKSKLQAVATDFSAVIRLRMANEEAVKADDEKFALSDKVDACIGSWRDGKRDNLRALIGSLDRIMWEGSDWKKVGMHELVQNSKVKFHYMKAIGKTHPDKLPQDASTEIRMIAAMVFATLNESWDTFKQQNGM